VLSENDYTKRYVSLLTSEEKLKKQIDDLKRRNVYLEAENEKIQCVCIIIDKYLYIKHIYIEINY